MTHPIITEQHDGWHVQLDTFHAIMPARDRATTLAGQLARLRRTRATSALRRPSDPRYLPLDGEDPVTIRPLRWAPGGQAAPVITAVVTCTSWHCRQADGRAWQALVIRHRGSDSDPRQATGYTYLRDLPAILGRLPEDVRTEHAAWHLANFPPSPRVALDAWIRHHAHLTWPEHDTDDHDRQLRAARAERAAEKRRK